MLMKIQGFKLQLYPYIAQSRGQLIISFSKRNIILPENSKEWKDFLEILVNSNTPVLVDAEIIVRDKLKAKYNLKKLGLLNEKKEITA